MDFVGELPESEGYNAILVITDRFTKVQHYIPAKTSWTSEDVANAYLNDIWKLHGLPKHVTSDRGPQFASAFSRALNDKLGIGLRLSTAHHPQTDGLSERAIQTLKQYLRIFCHDRQNTWVRWLPLAEFSHNSTATTHGYSPFRSLYGFDPRTIHVSDEPTASPAAKEWLDRMTAVHNDIHNTLKHINSKRSGLSLDKARTYNPGDKVLVDRRNLTIKEGNRSLTQKYIGPFTVKRKVGSHAYEVETPDKICLHKVI